LLQPRTALLPAAGDVSVDVLEDLQHMNKNICYNLFVILLHLRNMFATWSPASLAFLFCFLNEPFFASVICCRGDFFAAGGVFLLHANLTVKMVDPTAGDPGAGESDPPGDAQQFPKKFAKGNCFPIGCNLLLLTQHRDLPISFKKFWIDR
jgi:hypothetical protein